MPYSSMYHPIALVHFNVPGCPGRPFSLTSKAIALALRVLVLLRLKFTAMRKSRAPTTLHPVCTAREVSAGIAILTAAGLRRSGVRFISCPTCGRTEIDLISLASQVEERVRDLDRDITVAVMGCVVNGPGEAREADYGIAGGKNKGLLFRKGEVIGTYPYEELLPRLMDLIGNAEA